MKNIPKIIGIVLIVIVIGVLVGKFRESGTKIVIGGLFNLTGYGAFAGESSRDGLTMALEDAGIDGLQIDVVIEDANSDLKKIVSGATKLVELDKVIAVIGPEWTEFGEVAAPIAVKNKVPFLSPWVMAEAPYIKPPYYWTVTPSDRSEHIAITKYLAQRNLKKVTLVYSNNFWSQANIDMFKEEAAQQGLIILSEYKLDQTTKDFRTTIAKIKSEHPDALYAAIAEDEGYGAFVSQVRQQGITVPIAAHSARVGSPVMKEKYAAVMYNQIYGSQMPAQREKEFEEKYEKRFGKKVQAPSAAATYDITMILANAIKSGAKTSGQVISYLQAMQPYEGYSGTISFDKDGRVPMRSAIVKTFNKFGIEEEVR